MLNVRSLVREVKNLSYDPIEIKVREATSNDPWGATSTLMAEIAQSTYNYRMYSKCFAMIWKRITDVEHILHVQKALILVDYLVRNGHDRFVADAKKRARDILRLKKYKYYNKDHEDIASDVRVKAGLVHDLLMNDARLTEERQKAEKLRDVRLQSISSNDSMGFAASPPRVVPTTSSAQPSQMASQWSTIEQLKSSSGDRTKAASTPAAEETEDDDAESAKEKRKDKNGKDPFDENNDDDIEIDPFEDAQKQKPKDPPKEQKEQKDQKDKIKKKKKTTGKKIKKNASNGGSAGGSNNGSSNAGPRRPSQGENNANKATDSDGAFNAFASPGVQNTANWGGSTVVASVPTNNTSNTSLDDLFGLNNVNLATPAVHNNRSNVDILTGTGDWQDPFMTGNKSSQSSQAILPNSLSASITASSVSTPTNVSKNDIWDIASAFTNIDNLNSQPKKQEAKVANSGVTMGQMSELRSSFNPSPSASGSNMNAFGAPGPQHNNDPWSQLSGNSSNTFINYPSRQQNMQPNMMQSNMMQTNMMQPNMMQPNMMQPNMMQPNMMQSNMMQPNMMQSNAMQQQNVNKPFNNLWQ